jgi:hypothetical protein
MLRETSSVAEVGEEVANLVGWAWFSASRSGTVAERLWMHGSRLGRGSDKGGKRTM